MSLLIHAEAVQGLTRAFGAVTVAAQGATRRLEDIVGPGDTAIATMLAHFFTRAEAGLVGTQNVTEAEIRRRQFTRVGAQAGLVGNLNPTYAEISRRLFFRDIQRSKGDEALVAAYLQFFTRLTVNV